MDYSKSLLFKSNVIVQDYSDSVCAIYVNLINGRQFKFSNTIKCIIDRIDCPILGDKLFDTFKKYGSQTEVDELIRYLLKSKIYLFDRLEAIYETFLMPNTPTFFDCKHLYLDLLKSSGICFIGIPFGGGNCIDNRCRFFPNQFRLFCNEKSNFSFKEPFVFKVDNVDLGDLFIPVGEPYPVTFKKISCFITMVSHSNYIPISIGGDHSILYPIIKGLSEIHNDFVLLHFDAHSDHNGSYTSNIYDPLDIEFINHSNVISHCLKIERVRKIIHFGVRDYQVNRADNRVVYCSISDIKNKTDIYKTICNTQYPVYVSFDIDFLDPSVACGTPTRIPGGLGLEETVEVIHDVLNNKIILGADLVEVNPFLDVQDSTLFAAHSILSAILKIITNKII